MNRIDAEREEKLREALLGGLTVRLAAAKVGVARRTANERAKVLRVGGRCKCGRALDHRGCCNFRLQFYPGRQAYLAQFPPKIRAERSKVPEFYPFLAQVYDDHDLILRVNEIVPRSLPELMRGDVCQEAILAILEGHATLAELEQGGGIRSFVSAYWRANHERFGTLSLDAPLCQSDRPLSELVADLRDTWEGSGKSLLFRASSGEVVDTCETAGRIDLEDDGSEFEPEVRDRYFFRPRHVNRDPRVPRQTP